MSSCREQILKEFTQRGARKVGLSHIIRAPISQEWMIYIPAAETKDSVARVIYESKDGKSSKTFTALDWLAQLVTHIPNKGEQPVRYYGYYSNKSRGLRKKATAGDDLAPFLIEAEISTEEFRRNLSPLDSKGIPCRPTTLPQVQQANAHHIFYRR